MTEIKKMKNNDPLIIKIAELLEQQNKSQKELTDYLGITPNAFTDWKSGRLKSYRKYIFEIASFFGVSVAYLKGQPTIKNIAKQGQFYVGDFEKISTENQIEDVKKIYLDPEDFKKLSEAEEQLEIFTTVERIKKLCKEKKRSLAYLCAEMNVARVYFNDVIKSGRQIPDDKLEIIAKELDTTVAYLKGETDCSIRPFDFDMPEFKILNTVDPVQFSSGGMMHLGSPKVYSIPVYSSVEAGFGADLNENLIDLRFITLSTEEDAAKTIFATVKDNSMAPKIENGDLVQIYKTDVVDSGTVAVVIIDDKNISIRKVIYGHGWTELQASNPQYKPIRFEKDEIDRVRILGKITETISVNKDE